MAHIYNGFTEKFGIPRQSGRAACVMSRIVPEPEFRSPEAFRGMEGFSHLWLIFDFSEAHREGFSPTVRPPRLGGNTRVGVFASRSPFRPNSLGLSCVKLEGIAYDAPDGPVITVSGADLLNGTPIYDIKPYLPHADAHPEAAGGYSAAQADYRIEVEDADNLLQVLPEDERQAVIACIAEDPRPSYQDDPGRIYSMKYGTSDVHFTVSAGTAHICGIDVN